MGAFKKPKKPHIPPPPTRDSAADAVAAEEENERKRRLMQAGLTGTMLTGPSGVPGDLTATRQLTNG